ncbi:MAG TPA: tetratricopeptide repeat protein [Candidatus Ozemobacteraceae bacterium]|nr:tetratricopeptide repeat protein [Candidatus Ozemobacteraceae bacterium]
MKRFLAGMIVGLCVSAAALAGTVEELKIAAERGDPWAQTMLGVRWATGKDVGIDPVEAVEWFRKAAEQGYACAQYNLGYMHFNGLGVIKDYREAANWYRRAAEQGYVNAQMNLGNMYVLGQGVPRDISEAYFWLTLAASRSRKCIELRDKAGEALTPAERENVKERCRQWLDYVEKRDEQHGD